MSTERQSSAIKVCIVSPVPPPIGGIARWTMIMQIYNQRQTAADIRFIDSNVILRALHDKRPFMRIVFGILGLLRLLPKYLFQLVSYRPDIVHITTSGSFGLLRDIVLLQIAKILHIPTILHFRIGHIEQIVDGAGAELSLLKSALAQATSILLLDERSENAIKLIAPAVTTKVLPNPVICLSEAEIDLEESTLRPTAVFIGWVMPVKGVEELVKAWTSAAPTGWTLKIIGPGNATYCARLAQQAGPGIEFLGELEHERAMEELAKSKLLILPSHTEGFPNVVVEAMAHGKAIIASAVGAVPRMLDASTGIVISPQNIPELTQAIRAITSDTSLRATLGANARAKAEKLYSIESVFAAYVDTWTNTIKGRSR